MNLILTYDVKNVENLNKNNGFGLLIDKAIDEAGLKKKAVALKAGIHPGSLSRIISGEIGVARDTAISLVRATNRLANRELVNEVEALGLLKQIADDDAERIELMTMYSKRRKLTPAKKEAFRRILDMVDRELDRLYEESLAEVQEAPKKNGNQ